MSRRAAPAGAPSGASLLGALVVGALVVGAGTARAQGADDGCADGARFERGFASGSAWSGCARLDPVHGLELTALAWRAPGDAERPVLASIHPASILVQRAGERAAAERLGRALAALPETAATCPGERAELLPVPGAGGDRGALCTRRVETGLLSKYGDVAGVHGAVWWLESARRDPGGEIWQTRIGLGEEGSVEAELALSGEVAAELVARTVWRVAPALDSPAPDRIEELDFALDPVRGVRRPMRVREIGVEALRRTAPERFRVWRALDASGAGYLLDPRTSVAAATGFGPNWTGFELAVTARDDAERHASAPPTLDGFVDGESLAGADPVLWHALAMSVRPDASERASLGARALGFALLPFDWSPRSPFEDLAR